MTNIYEFQDWDKWSGKKKADNQKQIDLPRIKLWKESLNSDDQQLNRYLKSSNTKKVKLVDLWPEV
jgi:hypothetical protein